MVNLPWDMIGAIFGTLSFLLTLIVERNNLGPWRRVVIPVSIGALVFVVVGTILPLILPPTPPDPKETTLPSGSFYDNFDNSDYEGSVNKLLWLNNSPDLCEIYQHDGSLVFANQMSSRGVDCLLTIGLPSKVNTNNFKKIQANIKIEDDQVGDDINQGLYMTTNEIAGGNWRVFCGLTSDSEGAKALIEVSNYGSKNLDLYQAIPAEYNRWYKVDLQIDADNMMISCYADNTLVGSIIPSDATELRNANFQLHLDAWRPENSQGTTFVDDVVITP